VSPGNWFSIFLVLRPLMSPPLLQFPRSAEACLGKRGHQGTFELVTWTHRVKSFKIWLLRCVASLSFPLIHTHSYTFTMHLLALSMKMPKFKFVPEAIT
jgi:hypothetical protein